MLRACAPSPLAAFRRALLQTPWRHSTVHITMRPRMTMSRGFAFTSSHPELERAVGLYSASKSVIIACLLSRRLPCTTSYFRTPAFRPSRFDTTACLLTFPKNVSNHLYATYLQSPHFKMNYDPYFRPYDIGHDRFTEYAEQSYDYSNDTEMCDSDEESKQSRKRIGMAVRLIPHHNVYLY